MNKTYDFKDVKFMTAKEKETVLKAWKRFLDSDCEEDKFTKSLYHHLMQHCGYIAHYNIVGFYDEYFRTAVNKERFFKEFVGHYCMSEYKDINEAMLEIYKEQSNDIEENIDEEIKKKLLRLEISLDTAKNDPVYARKLLSMLGL